MPGPKGYSHGWIKDGVPTAPKLEEPSSSAGKRLRQPKSDPTKGMSLPDAQKYIAGHWTDWNNKLPRAQWDAMETYQGPDGYKVMNGVLRGTAPDQMGMIRKESVSPVALAVAGRNNQRLAAAIKTAPPLSAPITVFREFSSDQFGELAPGMTIKDAGFVSTTLMGQVKAYGGAGSVRAKMVIELPIGTRAAARSQQGIHAIPGAASGESARVMTTEIVLPPGATFRITGVTVKRGVTHVTATYSP